MGTRERGPVWWSDGSPDYNRHKAINTPYVVPKTTKAPHYCSDSPKAPVLGSWY